ncbi:MULTISPECIES: retron St85 family RNA-directed DNA polymerase [Yersinia]|uniref:RNA-directed DNA polymerase n=1 Tax=Yersinia frederiksenii TaxID=29484 RepID=A0AAI8ZVB2_YERFR|nr:MULTISPECIES: retron St85 family RNA-directed DNA polymerase [Yersinia]MDN0128157.1 retron St85 family RNA-directed DNA polymerase [Yersinia massiliensis]CFR16502.1 Retron-type reverse transcriptase [Yersinia frederiksenii]
MTLVTATHSHVYQLRNQGLPVMSTISDMAREVRLSVEMLKFLTYRTDYLYKTYEIDKKGKGSPKRIISQPSRKLKAIQGWVLRHILDHLSSSEFSKGFEKGQSILDNAVPHIGANFLLNIDLKDFFPSISASKVYRIFRSLGYNKEISSVLTNLCTYKGKLPQGSPTSPKLANLICSRLDARIQGYAGRRGIIYTRYADDLTLSAQALKKIEKAKFFIKTIIPTEDLKVNNSKTLLCGPRRQKKVTGLIISHDKAGIGREKLREIRSKIHKIFTEESLEYNHVRGLLAYVSSVDKKSHRKLVMYIDKLTKKYSGVEFII